MRFRGMLLSAAIPLATACAPSVHPPDTATRSLHADPLRRVRIAPAPPGARLVPIDVPESADIGVEPGGGTRAIAGGVRVLSLGGGGIVSTSDRLPGDAWDARRVIELPERLGGGFLFRVKDRSVWRADRWLGPARPIYESPATIARIVPGLDRVYVLADSWRAIDGTTGEPKPLGPWPPSPAVRDFAAADGWRALAVADLRGTVMTSDAGATWRPLPLPIEPRDLGVRGDSLEARGPAGSDTSFEVRPDGQVMRVPAERPHLPGPPGEASDGNDPSGPLGAHALLAAVEDGWPLEDGTALVARDGTLTRVRLDDGTIAESAPGAFPLRPARCHPIPLGAAGHIGFVCGEPHGATVLYSFDAALGSLTEARRFDAPRAVLSSGNGALAVRGPCDRRAQELADPEAHHYCVRSRDGAWREIRVEGAVGGERVAVLGDGRFVVVSPPEGNLDGARLTIVEGEHARSVQIPLAQAGENAEVRKVLGVGVWLDGVEERRPGVIGGWIEAAGTLLGYELGLDGKITFGAVRGDMTHSVASGRFGLVWSGAAGARSGFETTDGGMEWSPIEVPEPMKQPREVSRACGPVGCTTAGWLRIGWGTALAPPAEPPHHAHASLPRNFLSLPLDCVPTEVPPPPKSKGAPEDLLGVPPAAATATGMRLATYEASPGESSATLASVGRIYAWGPRSGDWDQGAKWIVRWDWPFGGASDARASAPADAPPLVVDAAKTGGGLVGAIFFWTIAPGDDPSHALLLAHRSSRGETILFELEADHAPVEIKRADGEPFTSIDAAARVGGRWYIATPPPPLQARLAHPETARSEATVWHVDGAVARELARVPRAPLSANDPVNRARLAWQADGRAIGLVVDGQPLAERSGRTRWVAAIDLDTGSVGPIESLGSFDLGDRTSVGLCSNDDTGWTTDIAVPFPIDLSPPVLPSGIPPGVAGPPLSGVQTATGRVRLGASRACVERVAGTLGPSMDTGVHNRPPASGAAAASITVAVTDGKARRVFRCGVR